MYAAMYVLQCRWKTLLAATVVAVLLLNMLLVSVSWRMASSSREAAVWQNSGHLASLSVEEIPPSNYTASQPQNYSENGSPLWNSSSIIPLGANPDHRTKHNISKSLWNADVCSYNLSTTMRPERDLERFISTLHTIIPPPTQFDSTFRNPCWYMYLSNPFQIRKLLRESTTLSNDEITLVMSYALLSTKQYLVCLPKIFFIGFPRSGSTQLFEMLVQHPEIVPGITKEPHWWTRFPFSVTFPRNIISILQYLLYFAMASLHIEKHPFLLTIDASQSTIWDTRTWSDLCSMPAIISNLIPDAKYIVIMREPGERLYSDFTYLLHKHAKKYTEDETYWNKILTDLPNIFHKTVLLEIDEFNSCLEKHSLEICSHYALDGVAYVDNITRVSGRVRLGISLYFVHITKWLRVIPREQFIFLRMEDLAKCPYSMLQRVWRFLDLEQQSPFELMHVLFRHANSNSYSKMLPETRTLLTDFFQPFNRELARVLNDRRYLWNDTTV